MRITLLLLALFYAATSASAAEWQPVATDLLAKEKPGYGGLSGVAVDRDTGTLYVCLSDRGVYRSTDQGKTWEKHGKETPKGRTETPGCLSFDPTAMTKQFLMATVYGAPVILGSLDPKADWRMFDKKCSHVDWCALDWTDPERKFVIAFKHESGGVLLISRDGGKTFAESAKGHGFGAWVFDNNTAVVARAKSKDNPKGGILRTTDGGRTFEPVAEFATVCVPKPHGDSLYWLCEGTLLRGADKGAKWEKLCDVPNGRYGPIFGKDAKHMFILTNTGVIETTDGGKTWSLPLAIPKELKGVSPLTWLDYDSKNDVLYVMKMTSDLYRLQRSK